MSEAKKFRKKPVVIEAWLFDGTASACAEVVTWLPKKAEYHHALMDGVLVAHPQPFLRIPTLEGVMIASPGDYIIKGVAGEFYPCKPDIFEATYEPLSDTSTEGERT